MQTLSRDTILSIFAALADEMPRDSGLHELVVVGGAALVTLYDARETTRDVDAVIVDPEVLQAAKVVGIRYGLSQGWLNDAAKGFLHGLAVGETIFSSDTLVVRALAPRQLLAMKLSAWRDDVDIEDARLLLNKLTGTKAEIWSSVEVHLVPGRELKAKYAFEDIWELDRGHP